jgi:hypothetical protein
MVNTIVSAAVTADKLIISSEMLEKVVFRGNLRLRDFLDYINAQGYIIRILYVIRRPDHALDSVFKQWVASYDTKFKDDPTAMAWNAIGDHSYAQVAERWKNLQGVSEVIIVPLFEGKFKDGLRTILERIEFPGLDSISNLPKANPSLDGPLLRFKHFINRLEFERELNEWFLASALEAMMKAPPRATTVFTPESRRSYLANFQSDWWQLADVYGTDLSGWRASEESVADKEIFKSLSQSEIPDCLAMLRAEHKELASRFEALLAHARRE